jgi:hypothetical protein
MKGAQPGAKVQWSGLMFTSVALLAHCEPSGATTVNATVKNQFGAKVHEKLIGVKLVLMSSGPLIWLTAKGGPTACARLSATCSRRRVGFDLDQLQVKIFSTCSLVQ